MSYNQVVANYITWVLVVCMIHTPAALGPSRALGVYIRQTVHARDGMTQGTDHASHQRYHDTTIHH